MRNFAINTLIALGSAAPSAWAQEYTITDLGHLGYAQTGARSLSQQGLVTGNSLLSGPSNAVSHAFRWENGFMQDLGILPGYSHSIGLGINDLGDVAGYLTLGSPSISGYQAFLWQGGSMIELGAFGGQNSSANDINNSGVVVGYAEDESGIAKAAVWYQGQAYNLGSLSPNGFSFATAINEQGMIVGRSVDSAGLQQAFIWREGSMIKLGTLPGGISSEAHDLNARAQAVGASSTGWEANAVAWVQGQILDLGKLPGDTIATAFSINNHGQIVGESKSNLFNRKAFLWRDGAMHELNSLIAPDSGWNLFTASKINDQGQIAGTGEFGGKHRGYLLTPVK